MDLYDKLLDGYTLENLTRITAKIIEAYRNKNHNLLHNLINCLGETVHIVDSKINKSFSKLIMLYHPDRLVYYRKEIKKNHARIDDKRLNQFSHIFQTLEFINNANN